MDQQWDEVVLSKRGNKPKDNTGVQAAARSSGAQVVSTLKYGAGSNTQNAGPRNAAAIDAETDAQPIETVKLEVRRRIQQARQEKKMTQKELAAAINVKPTVVNEYESGKAVPNAAVLAKMERILGVKLRGDLNKPLKEFKRSANPKGGKSAAKP